MRRFPRDRPANQNEDEGDSRLSDLLLFADDDKMPELFSRHMKKIAEGADELLGRLMMHKPSLDSPGDSDSPVAGICKNCGNVQLAVQHAGLAVNAAVEVWKLTLIGYSNGVRFKDRGSEPSGPSSESHLWPPGVGQLVPPADPLQMTMSSAEEEVARKDSHDDVAAS